MTSISYEEIFSDFLGGITDYSFASMNINEAYELFIEYLHKAAASPYSRNLFSQLNFVDEIMVLYYEMDFPTDDDSDKDFVRSVLSKGMTIEWLKPQVRSKVNLSQMFAGSEQKFYSQSAHISELRALLEDSELELRKMIRDRGYIHNSYLEG